MADVSYLPNAPTVELDHGLILQPPLSRCGYGPGLIILRPNRLADCQDRNDSLDPEPLIKWAEESYMAVQITVNAQSHTSELVEAGINIFLSRDECQPKDKFALLVYGSPIDYPLQFNKAIKEIDTRIVAEIYFHAWDLPFDQPSLIHLSGSGGAIEKHGNTFVYSYPEASSAGFIIPGHQDFKISTAGVAHTRSLGFLKKHLQGPYFDLEKIWEEHAYYEFGDRSVEKTMATMVQEPYVNHIPTVTGGIGRAHLSKFYLNHFIFNNPEDTELDLISRTIGTDRIVDEFIFCLTHNKEIDWLIPGIPPTGRFLSIPMTAIVNIRGDRLYHEHIAWDQATILVQLGLIPEYLPYPYALPGGRQPGPGRRFEYRVPAAGAETAQKLKDEHSVPSNQMFEYAIREVDF